MSADRWDGLGRPVPVRLFDSLLSTLRGGPSLTESLGLTPTDAGVPEEEGRRGPGALGVPLGADVRDTELALLTGRRRARLRELTEVADLYASDGRWLHPSPWREEPVPVSRLLVDAYEAVAVDAFHRAADGLGDAGRIERALDRLDGVAELTVSGKAVVAALRLEFGSER
ncbi:hypothetical protein ACIQWN_20950 [Streptomyces vinaceus]|uniref:hypothetical protein n=1 Tax=Streptomyces vinaceus TaxID=1960 RepID=UPI00381943B1